MKKFIALVLIFALSFTSLPLAYADFANGTLVQTETGFKPIEHIRGASVCYPVCCKELWQVGKAGKT
ncbi:hypothetical protein [Paenibacillus popilliae]|uniref:hypothetical protein n=1 Tax=Paenibacillus popilliae TaxID=78057 RepID=UPI000305683D|nr:hypothetical protein [Paenibacillus popilliae]